MAGPGILICTATGIDGPGRFPKVPVPHNRDLFIQQDGIVAGDFHLPNTGFQPSRLGQFDALDAGIRTVPGAGVTYPFGAVQTPCAHVRHSGCKVLVVELDEDFGDAGRKITGTVLSVAG